MVEEAHYLIIGNSTAAVGAVEGIRETDKTGSITILSTEPYHTYSRPLISYLLLGKTDEQRMKYRPDDFYEKNNINFCPGETVTQICTGAHTVKAVSGKEYRYKKLLVATGSRPFVPPMTGIEKVKNVFSFLSLGDAKSLQCALTKDSHVLIIGAGLIGLKCAEGIMNSVQRITVVDLADRVLPSILNEEGSARVQRHLEQLGLSFILGDSIASFEETAAVLKSGTRVKFDVVVTAVGVRPNTELVKTAGGMVNRGIVTDSHGATSLEDVYAAGDCTESFDITADMNRILALLPNAYLQGECAGICMAGGTVSHEKAIPMNAIGFAGLHIVTAGSYEGEQHLIQNQENYKLLFTKDNVLKGFILIGDVSRAGIYTSLIRNKTPLSSIDFELILQKPQLMAFAQSDRIKLLSK